MSERVLMRGSEALVEAAIRADCKFYAGYPITPHNELLEHIAERLPAAGGVFIPCEGEVAGINYVYGAASAGFRAMTSSSGVGIGLMQEALSAAAAAQLPFVVVNISRGGPGVLGTGYFVAQSDYYQATRGGGNGDYHLIVLAPQSVPEMAQLTYLAFDLADEYRNPVMILADGLLGQMAEDMDTDSLPYRKSNIKDWATTGAQGRRRNSIYPLAGHGFAEIFYDHPLEPKYTLIREREARWEDKGLDDADIVLVAYGTSARVALEAMEVSRARGIKVGMIRPITLWPFPQQPFAKAADGARAFLAVEMSTGQMVDDVRLAVGGKAPVHHLSIYVTKPSFSPLEICEKINAL
jgi:2-oxoglutarate ferredoxin oxidoreductase subunit alpha